ncbi:MAG: hypothetical protein K2W96_03155 [Gemmataceae bacterium]|nr:hypothetical protein [Gemmataceae bacterium]
MSRDGITLGGVLLSLALAALVALGVGHLRERMSQRSAPVASPVASPRASALGY